VPQIDQRNVEAAPSVIGQQIADAKGAHDLIQVAAFDRRVDDADPPAGAGRAQRIVDDRPQHRGMRRRARQILAGQPSVEVLVGDEVRLDQDAVARSNDIRQRVPRGRARPRSVEP